MTIKYILDLRINDPVLEKGVKQAILQLTDFDLAAEDAIPDMVLTDDTQGEDMDRVMCLTPGKGFRIGAFLQALLDQNGADQKTKTSLKIGEMIFYPEDKKILPGIGETAIALTDLETRLLLHLARHRGQTYSKDALLKEVWEYQTGVTTHTVETHIYRLRQKLPLFENYLVTTDAGYMLK